MKQTTLFAILVLIAQLSLAQQAIRPYTIAPSPDWVRRYELPEIDFDKPFDRRAPKRFHQEVQLDAESESIFHRIVFRIGAAESPFIMGIDFEPAYQRVQLHSLARIRKGEKKDLGKNLQVTEQLETEQVAGTVYDTNGEIKFSIPNVRKGDLVEVAYSKTGNQPDFQGRVFGDFSLGNYAPVENWIFLLRYPADRKVQFQEVNCTSRPKRWQSGGHQYHEMQVRDARQSDELDGAPAHYDPNCRCRISEFETYSEIVEWTSGFYIADSADLALVRERVGDLTKGAGNTEEKANRIQRFVQDEIEYEDYGLYDPKTPRQTLSNMHGDCKSKTWLAIEMLRQIGVEAWPILVHFGGQDSLRSTFPSSQNFDHVIVGLKLGGEEQAFDATANSQFAGIKQSFLPDFGKGLFIREGENELRDLPGHSIRSIELTDTIWGMGSDSVTLKRTGLLGGGFAEELAWGFEQKGIQAIRDFQPDGYENSWKPIQEFDFSEKEGDFSLERVPDPEMAKVRFRSAYTYVARFVREDLSFRMKPFVTFLPKTFDVDRRAPYRLSKHLRLKQRLVVIGMEEKSVIPALHYDRFGMEADFQMRYLGDTLVLDAALALKKGSVPSDSLSEFNEDLHTLVSGLHPKDNGELYISASRRNSFWRRNREVVQIAVFSIGGILLLLGGYKVFEIIRWWVRRRRKNGN